MGFAYLKTVHGILSVIQVVLGFLALLGGYMLYNGATDELYWLFFQGQRPLISVVLAILLLGWLLALAVLAQQLFVRDLVEELGKTKLLLLHFASAAAILAAAIIESYYVSRDGGEESSAYYMKRLIFVMSCCWLLFISHVVQFIFVLLQ